MDIALARIDDRLIHGQIVTAWVQDTKASELIVADDKAANDEMQKMMLKLATPGSMKLSILSIADVAKKFSEDQSDTKVLLLLRNPGTALELINAGVEIPKLNVGNISNSRSVTGRKKILMYIYLEEADAKNLEELIRQGVELDVRSVPTDKSMDGQTLISKYYE